MSVATATMGGAGRNKLPFTATQWQELEHQALFYKYMAAGVPIPSDLLFTIKHSLHSTLSSKLFSYQPSPLGWNPYQLGYGKKIDPEPGRCRRTDGKKWRCSKEAYPDSKYCERHMHRGKNRSRKPVESPLSLSNNSSTATNTFTNNTNNSSSLTPPSSFTNQSLLTINPSTSLFSFPSSDSSCNSHLLYPHSSSYNHKDYRERYFQGIKDEVGEHAFFRERSGSSIRGYPGLSLEESWQLGGTNTGNLDQHHHHHHHHHSKQSGGYPNYLQSKSNKDAWVKEEKQCCMWVRDFNSDSTNKVEDERDNNFNGKTTHHFFDEWPIKGGGRVGTDTSWHDSSTTQLSISIPTSTPHRDFFLTDSRDP